MTYPPPPPSPSCFLVIYFPPWQVLQQFYIDLRQNYRSPDSTPITTRQIESLVRLAEARARLELREEVTQQDAEDVVEMMKCAVLWTYFPP